MLNLWGRPQRLCDRLSRRDFLRVGTLGVGGLSLANLLQLKAQGAVRAESAHKAVIMVYLNGGPSHMDMYDLKPEAPVEYRGEFKPIQTNVPGLDICELMPLQAQIADKMAIVRNMKFLEQGHKPSELYTGFLNSNRPSIGSVVSRLRKDAGLLGTLPPYVALDDGNNVGAPGFLGTPHQAFLPGSQSATSMDLKAGFGAERIGDRKSLLQSFDTLRRDMDDARGNLAGMDSFTRQALEMITTTKARDAFDLSKEPDRTRQRYGKQTEYLLARRLVEAGVSVVTLTPTNHGIDQKSGCNCQWDHHDQIHKCLRVVLPQLDQSIHALVTDLHERGLDKDVAVVVWGEMGRTPLVGGQKGTSAGRDHWPDAGFALLSGGGLPMGQVIGATDAKGARPKGQPYTPQNVLATLYHVLGIDAGQTALPDHMGRPIHLLDDPEKIKELA